VILSLENITLFNHSASAQTLQTDRLDYYGNTALCTIVNREVKTVKTRAKDVLPNINRTQAAVSVHCRRPFTPGGDEMVSSAAA